MKRLLLVPLFLVLFMPLLKAGVFELRPAPEDYHRIRPLATRNFNGDHLLGYFGGMKGRYLRNVRIGNGPRKVFIERVLVDNSGKGSKPEEELPESIRPHFVANSDSILNATETIKSLKPIGVYLQHHPGAKVVLTGNTGTNLEDKQAPIGGGKEVLNYPAMLNGKKVVTSELMQARANAIATILIRVYGISPSRISTKAGVQSLGEGGRNVGIDVIRKE